MSHYQSGWQVLDWFDEFKTEGRLKQNASNDEKKAFINGLVERIVVFYDAKHNIHTLNVKFIMPLVNRPNSKGTIGINEVKYMLKKPKVGITNEKAHPPTTQSRHGGIGCCPILSD